MSLHIYKTVDEVIKNLADYFVQTVNDVIAQKDECSVVLSGGNSPLPFYELLASEEYRKKVDWSKIFFFFADERYVPSGDPDNNGSMIRKILFDSLNIHDSQIFYVNTSLPPDRVAEEYNERILNFFKNELVHFDLVLLGLGNDGHTASLFPHTKVLKDRVPQVRAVYLEDKNAYRITMTAPLINQAKIITFLVYGKEKAKALREVLKGEKDLERYPAQLIVSETSKIKWFIDEVAARGLV